MWKEQQIASGDEDSRDTYPTTEAIAVPVRLTASFRPNKNNTLPSAGGCLTFQELRPRLHSPSVDEKIGRAVAGYAFFSALTLAQRALAAAAIFRRAARLMVRFLGAAVPAGAASVTMA